MPDAIEKIKKNKEASQEDKDAAVKELSEDVREYRYNLSGLYIDANQVDKALWDQMATIPLYQKPTFIGYRASLENVVDNASVQRPLWNSDRWAVKQ